MIKEMANDDPGPFAIRAPRRFWAASLGDEGRVPPLPSFAIPLIIDAFLAVALATDRACNDFLGARMPATSVKLGLGGP